MLIFLLYFTIELVIAMRQAKELFLWKPKNKIKLQDDYIKAIHEFKDKISDDDKKELEKAVKEAEKHLESNDKSELENAGKELSEKMQSIGAKLYQAAADDAKSDDKKSDGKSSDDAVEGEVVDKK